MPEKHEHDHRDERLVQAILVLARTIEHSTHKIMTALENLNTSVGALTAASTDLTEAVNAAVQSIGSPTATDAQLNAITAIVDHNTEVVVAQAAALRAAVAAESQPPAPPTQ